MALTPAGDVGGAASSSEKCSSVVVLDHYRYIVDVDILQDQRAGSFSVG